MMNQWPFPVQNIYIPDSCNAKQIESLTKARIISTNIYIGNDSPYLYVSTYTHLQADESSLTNKPNGKWLPIPEKYNIPCYFDDAIKDQTFILIPSGKPLLYWRCKSKDFLSNICSSGAQLQTTQNVV